MSKQPNILLICTDHWPGKMISALGHPDILTPTLDTAIGNGVAFTNAYTTTPMCVPARRALMTGCFSRTHGDRGQGNLPTMVHSIYHDASQIETKPILPHVLYLTPGKVINDASEIDRICAGGRYSPRLCAPITS